MGTPRENNMKKLANDLMTLCALADVILDGDDAKVYCRGIGTTPKKLGDSIDRVRKYNNEILVTGE